jgi:hypothetical protein
MDSKFYVSLEAAKLLKEKGYNEMTDCSIDEDGNFWNEQRKNETMPEWKWSCPTKDEAMDWLEQKGAIFELIYNKFWDYFMCIYCGNQTAYTEQSGNRLIVKDMAIIKALELL